MTVNSCETGRTVPNGPFQLDFKELTCILPDGSKIELTPQQMRVLSRLSTDRFRSTRDIATSVAFETYPAATDNPSVDIATLISDDTILGLICNLRRKLGKEFIESKNRFGYRLKKTLSPE